MDCSFDPTGLCDIAVNKIFLSIWNSVFIPLGDAIDKLSWEVKLSVLGLLFALIILKIFYGKIKGIIDRLFEKN
jgi:hypothetical protein